MRLMKCMILTCLLKCIINNCKPPQSFEFPESLFGLKSIYGFVSLAQLAQLAHSVLLFYSLWPIAVKHSKNINMLQQEHTKRVKECYIDF